MQSFLCILTANFFWLFRLHFFFRVWFCYLLCSLVSLISICSLTDTKPLDTISKKEKKTMMKEKKNCHTLAFDWIQFCCFFSTMNQCVISNNLNARKYSFDIAKSRWEKKKKRRATKETTKLNNKIFRSLLLPNYTQIRCKVMNINEIFLCLCCRTHVYSISLVLHLMTFRVAYNTKARIYTIKKHKMINTIKCLLLNSQLSNHMQLSKYLGISYRLHWLSIAQFSNE